MKIIKGIVMIGLTILSLGWLIPYLWPLVEDTLDAVEGMGGGDSGALISAYWPIILIVVAVGIGIGVVVYALREIGLIRGKKND